MFDLQLAVAAVDYVDLGGYRVDLDAQLAGRLVHQVNGLVGEEAIGYVAVRQGCCRYKRTVLDSHTVMDLVALLEPAQDRDGLVGVGWFDHDLLEATLECRVGFDVSAVLVEGGSTDHAEAATGQHRLEHVAGVHGSLGCARSNHGVQFIQEGDDLAVGFVDLGQHGLQPFLKLAAV